MRSDMGDAMENDGMDKPNTAMLRLRESLSALPSDSAAEFLCGVRELIVKIDSKTSDVVDELAEVDENLADKLNVLASHKKDLLKMKEEVVTLRDTYLSDAKHMLDHFKKEIPIVVSKLEDVARKQTELQRLEFFHRSRDLVSQCKEALFSQNIDDISMTFGSAEAHFYQTKVEEDRSVFQEPFMELCKEIRNFSTKGINNILDKIKFPFEDSIDHKAFSNEAAELSDLLALFYRTSAFLGVSSLNHLTCEAIFSRLRKRFLYMFYGEKKTNSVSKPQWFLTIAITWLQTSLPFFELVLTKCSRAVHVDFEQVAFFHRELSQLVNNKVEDLLQTPDVLLDSYLFSNLIDECISYEDQRSAYDFGRFGSNVMNLFSGEEILTVWITVEKNCCIAKIDHILEDPNRWVYRFRDLQNIDQYLVCECTEAFVSLIQGLQQRSRFLEKEYAQRQFIDLQLILVDDYRQRLVQISGQTESPWTTPYPQVMNSFWYMIDVVEEWNEMFMLAGLQYGSGDRMAFDTCRQCFEHVWAQMADDLVKSLQHQCQDLSHSYQQYKWNALLPKKALDDIDFTPQFYPLLMKVRTAFSIVAAHFSKVSLPRLFQKMTSVVAEILLNDVIRMTAFSSDGGVQMLYDIEKGLIPCLNFVYNKCELPTRNVENNAKIVKLIGALRLLSLTWSNGKLLMEELEGVPDVLAEEKLLSMKIIGVSKEEADELFTQRSDLKDSEPGLRLR